MASNTNLFQHPLHREHPLESINCSKDRKSKNCHLCWWWISADAYACLECEFYIHRVCAEAPTRIDNHPLHTQHPITLSHQPTSSQGKPCNSCSDNFHSSLFRCDECDFALDIRCALSTLSDWGGGTFTQGKTPEQIKLPLHPHTLTSFSTMHEFIRDGTCFICDWFVEEEGFVCLHRECGFLIHKKCFPDLYYKDGTKATKVCHKHPLEIFLGENMDSTRCSQCLAHESSQEFIGCARCGVRYCRDCVKVPEIIQYPRHPDHNLMLLINPTDNEEQRCDSCSMNLLGILCYGCPLCKFFVDVECAFQVIMYCDEGIRAAIELSWHEHPLLLCHKTVYKAQHCSYCETIPAGPMYRCRDEDCQLLLHKGCTEIESTINHPHHQNHPLTLGRKNDMKDCGACGELIRYLTFSCELCAFYLHAKCSARVPTRKHPLHEHQLIHLEKASFWICNRCGTDFSSPFFRCVPCDFNLHEECLELPPQVVNGKVHWHPLTLHATYLEDDSGEYYCDQCEERRDGRMGAYVCLQCSARWACHIECIFPELRKVCVLKPNSANINRLARDIMKREEEIQEAERKLDEMKRELDEQRKIYAAITNS